MQTRLLDSYGSWLPPFHCEWKPWHWVTSSPFNLAKALQAAQGYLNLSDGRLGENIKIPPTTREQSRLFEVTGSDSKFQRKSSSVNERSGKTMPKLVSLLC